ncbi:hypothetical protein KR044_004733, partial [Drosophila immigrans]
HTRNACMISMSQRKSFRGNQAPTYWWNGEIAAARRLCLSARRRFQRARRRNDHDWPDLHRTYCTARKTLKKAIKMSKRECFLQMCDSADGDPWDRA